VRLYEALGDVGHGGAAHGSDDGSLSGAGAFRNSEVMAVNDSGAGAYFDCTATAQNGEVETCGL
jgi:hypothetical protein